MRTGTLVLAGVFIAVICQAEADTNFLSRYNGTSIRLTTTTCITSGPCQIAISDISIISIGVRIAGEPLMKEKVIYKDRWSTRSFYSKGNNITFESIAYNGNRLQTRIVMRENGCDVVVSMTAIPGYRLTTKCEVVRTAPDQPRDTHQACEAVSSAIVEMKSLLAETDQILKRDPGSHHSWAVCGNAARIGKISRSIKGAACPSLFPEVDALAKAGSGYCQREAPADGGPGVRG